MTSLPIETDRALIARSVSKTFGTVRALHDVELAVHPGRVHAIVGENGAGKSTLAKILAGIERPDAAQMTLGGAPFRPHDRAEARRQGVTMVPQQLSLVGELTLVENLLLVGDSPLARRGRARALLAETLARADVEVDLDVPTRRLSQAHRQLGEIVVALAEGARILILDEPTASLGPREVGGLFAHVRALCAQGTAVVLITHRLEEVREVADEVTVLSHGEDVHHGPAAGLEPRRIAQLMVGELAPPVARPPRVPGDVVIDLEGVSASSVAHAPIRDVSLRVRAGEVVGVAGVAGSGQNTLIDVIAGFEPPQAGTVRVAETAGGARAMLEAGVAWIPEERAEALVPERPVGENLEVYARATGRRAVKEARGGRRERMREILRSFDVRPPEPSLAAGGLSGGNQQKLLVARELGPAGPARGRRARCSPTDRARGSTSAPRPPSATASSPRPSRVPRSWWPRTTSTRSSRSPTACRHVRRPDRRRSPCFRGIHGSPRPCDGGHHEGAVMTDKSSLYPTEEELAVLRAVASGRRRPDLVIRGGLVQSPGTQEWLERDVVIAGRHIATLTPWGHFPESAREIDASGSYVVPTFIDAHLHIEYTNLTPGELARLSVARGTTTVLTDPNGAPTSGDPRGWTSFCLPRRPCTCSSRSRPRPRPPSSSSTAVRSSRRRPYGHA